MNVLRSDGIKFRELAELFRGKIDSGELKPGDVIPSEPCLQEQYNVSRMTVRNAIELLANEGLLKKERGRGRGTVVLKKADLMARQRKGLSFGIPIASPFLYSDRSDMPDIINGMINRLNLWESNLNVFPLMPEINQFEYMKNIISRNLVDGFFLMGMVHYTGDIISFLQKKNFPFLFISSLYEDRLNMPEYPLIYVTEQETVNSFLQSIKNKFNELAFIGLEGVEVERTYNLFINSPAGLGVKMRKETFKPTDDLFFKLVSIFRKGNHAGNLFIISSRNILQPFKAAVKHAALKIPKDASVLYFKHYASNYEDLINEYDSMERDFIELGKQAADMMEQLINDKKASGNKLFYREIKSVFKKRGSISF